MGHGVEVKDRYSNIMESMVDQRFYNISIPANFVGYEKLVHYAEGIREEKIKHLIVGVCMDNDLNYYPYAKKEIVVEEDSHDYAAGLDNNKIVHGSVKEGAQMDNQSRSDKTLVNPYREAKFASRSFKDKLKKKFALYNLVAHIANTNEFIKKIAIKAGVKESDEDKIGRYHDTDVTLRSSEVFNDIFKDYNPIVLVIPSRALWVGTDKEKKLAAKIHETFVELLEGFRVIDMRDSLEEDGDPLKYYYKVDGHWNPEGHTLAAKKIRDLIVKTQ